VCLAHARELAFLRSTSLLALEEDCVPSRRLILRAHLNIRRLLTPEAVVVVACRDRVRSCKKKTGTSLSALCALKTNLSSCFISGGISWVDSSSSQYFSFCGAYYPISFSGRLVINSDDDYPTTVQQSGALGANGSASGTFVDTLTIITTLEIKTCITCISNITWSRIASPTGSSTESSTCSQTPSRSQSRRRPQLHPRRIPGVNAVSNVLSNQFATSLQVSCRHKVYLS